MAFEKQTLNLKGDTPGSTTEMSVFRIGPPDAPDKIVLQAALHADGDSLVWSNSQLSQIVG